MGRRSKGYFNSDGSWSPSSWRDYHTPASVPSVWNGGMPVKVRKPVEVPKIPNGVYPPSVIAPYRSPIQSPIVSPVNSGVPNMGQREGGTGAGVVIVPPVIRSPQGVVPAVPQHVTGSMLPAYASAGANKNVVPDMLSPEQQAWARAALGDTKGALEQAVAGGMSLADFANLMQYSSGGGSGGSGHSGSGGGTQQAVLSYTPEQYAQFQKNTNAALGEINKAYDTAGSQISDLLTQYANAGAAQQAGAANTLQAFGVAPSASQVSGALPQDYLNAIQGLLSQGRVNQQSDLANRLNAYKALVQ